MSYTGFFDIKISDREVCSRVWTMVARLHGFGSDIPDNDEEDDMGGKRRTPEETAEIVRRLKAGETPESVAKDLDRDPGFVRTVARDEGVELPDRRGSNLRKGEAKTPAAKRSARSRKAGPARTIADGIATPAADPLVSQIREEAARLRERAEKLDAAADALE